MPSVMTIEAEELLPPPVDAVVFDCRFSLADPAAGRALYSEGHIPGACFLDLNEDLAGPVGPHGGRHPLPEPAVFAACLASFGVGPQTLVIAYDDSRFAGGARLWWLMRALGYCPPLLLNGGYQAWLNAGGAAVTELARRDAVAPPAVADFRGYCDVNGLREAQAEGAMLVDSREERRYQGLEEPIDPVAGHIPGAINRPWQGVSSAAGSLRDETELQAHWGDALEAEQLVVYCGSGITACVNLFSLARLGREDATLYAGSWSDWCSHLTGE